ncbi:hypothetical protein KAX97_10665 [candidate division WOR-3 bacterium]|nr:hypothetical protein [candidate division WOR-3 bacterium]
MRKIKSQINSWLYGIAACIVLWHRCTAENRTTDNKRTTKRALWNNKRGFMIEKEDRFNNKINMVEHTISCIPRGERLCRVTINDIIGS